MSGLVWGLEWRRALARRRLMTLNVVVPMALIVPIVLSPAPAVHASAVYAVLFVMFGTFGSAIPLLRDSENGLIRRVGRTGLQPASILVERVLAGSAIDIVQLVPAVAVLHLAGPKRGAGLLLTLATLGAALVTANAVGTWIAALARSVAEGALFAAVTALLLLHASGVFRTPAPGTMSALVESSSPYRGLHDALLSVSSGAGHGGWEPVVVTAVGAIVALGVSALVARALLRLLLRDDTG